MNHNTQKDKKFRKRPKVQAEKETGTQNANDKTSDVPDNDGRAVVGGASIRRPVNENDPSWYAGSAQLLKDAFSLSVAERLGMPLKTQIPNMQAVSAPYTQSVNYSVPGICNLIMVPTPGISTNSNSAVNAAAKQVFTAMRAANSGRTNYQASDLMLYLLAMDNAYCLWNWLVRLYGVLTLYSARNAYLPDGLLLAMRVDPSIKKDMCQLRAVINQYANKLNTLKVPKYMTYFTRHAWLFGNIYLDSPEAKAQMYLYNPQALYKWNENVGLGEQAYLEPVTIVGNQESSAYWKLDGIVDLVNQFIDPIFYSEDFNIMSGDVLKAFGDSNCFNIAEITEDYVTPVGYSPEVLVQIENAKIGMSLPSLDNTWRITQNAQESIIFNPTVNINVGCFEDQTLFNFHSDVVTPDLVAVATRFNLIVNETDLTHAAGEDTASCSLASCGSEIITGCEYITRNQDNSGYNKDLVRSAILITATSTAADLAFRVGMVSQFDWAPLCKIIDTVGSSVHYLGDLDNYTQIDSSTLITMNDVALLSMFGIPAGGR